jgi:hypothetical protein
MLFSAFLRDSFLLEISSTLVSTAIQTATRRANLETPPHDTRVSMFVPLQL